MNPNPVQFQTGGGVLQIVHKHLTKTMSAIKKKITMNEQSAEMYVCVCVCVCQKKYLGNEKKKIQYSHEKMCEGNTIVSHQVLKVFLFPPKHIHTHGSEIKLTQRHVSGEMITKSWPVTELLQNCDRSLSQQLW